MNGKFVDSNAWTSQQASNNIQETPKIALKMKKNKKMIASSMIQNNKNQAKNNRLSLHKQKEWISNGATIMNWIFLLKISSRF